MPGRYRIYSGKDRGKYGVLIAITREKITIKLDNGKIITSPPTRVDFLGQISNRRLNKILTQKPNPKK